LSDPAPAEKVNILVVDDHVENLLALQATLSNPAYNIISAASGEDALKQVLRHEIAVILLDVVMPKMDGFETAQMIRQREASKDIPVIFLTAKVSDINLIYKAYSVGAVDYLVKPVDSDVVRAKVAVFVDLFRKTRQIQRQQEQLRERERRRSQQALQESEAQYEATFNEAAVGIAHIGADGHWLRVNQRLCDILGYLQEELLRLRFQDITYPEDVAESMAAIARLVRGETGAHRAEQRFLHRRGHLVWVNLSVSVLRDVAGVPKHMISIIEDITGRKHREERQKLLAAASTTLLSSLDYKTTLASVAQLAVPRLGDWCIIEVIEESPEPANFIVAHSDLEKAERSRRALSKLADDSDGVLRTRKSELISEFRPELFAPPFGNPELVAALCGPGLTSAMIVPLIARERVLGSITIVSAESRRRYDPADLAFVEELAHRAAFAVENAQLYQQAQNAIRARDEFLSIASHELRTPLTPLQLQLQRLVGERYKQTLEKLSPERLQDILKRSERQVHRLSSLIDNLLDVSRITSGRMKLQPERMDLAEVVRDVTGRFSEELNRSECTLKLQLSDPVVGLWDRLRVEQIVTNLLVNAIKYGSGKPIEIAVERNNRSARFTIRDHGIGIPFNEQARIFGRFERAVSNREYGGLGLGLYITRQIVDAHNGSIAVESDAGAGAFFTVELPLESSAEIEQRTGQCLASDA
jgi:PAS domain S-box-containing protein